MPGVTGFPPKAHPALPGQKPLLEESDSDAFPEIIERLAIHKEQYDSFLLGTQLQSNQSREPGGRSR